MGPISRDTKAGTPTTGMSGRCPRFSPLFQSDDKMLTHPPRELDDREDGVASDVRR
jgi:hypothetical protein